MKALLACLLVLLSTEGAFAATGDTLISIAYKVKSVRIKPQPVSGVGSVKIRVVLRSDGKVDDVVESKGGKNTKRFEQKDRNLGSQTNFTGQWRVIDESTLERRSVEKNHDLVVRVKVKGKSCTAEVSYPLHAGQKEYVLHSPKFDKTAYYSLIQPFDVKCKIE